MEFSEMLTAARTEMGGKCKACPVCNGLACGNTMPGPGSKAPGNVAARNYAKWQEICVNMDTLCENRPADTSFELFGKRFAAPIFAAPLGAVNMHYGEKYNDLTYNSLLVPTCAEYGIAAFTGDGADASVLTSAADAIAQCGGMGIPTVKPWNREMVFEKLDYINTRMEAFAIAMDVDGAGLPFLKALNPNAGSKSVSEMREIIAHAGRPFIIKGIMTPAGAEKAIEAGAAAIVVSNHGGRVQGGVPATAEVLPAIADAVGGRIRIFVDGGIRSGLDVFRALALGADAVLIGRPVVPFIYGAGADGLRAYLDKIIGDLSSTMTMCGTPTLNDIGRGNIFMP